MTTTTKTDRDRFAHFIPSGNYLVRGLTEGRLAKDAIAGLEAAAGLFFGEYEDEDTLPPALIAAYNLVSNLTYETSDLYEEAIWGDDE